MPDAINKSGSIPRPMHRQVLNRVGVVLLAIGLLDGIVTIVRLRAAGPYPAVLGVIAIAAGVSLLRGGPRTALWVRTLASFLLAASLVLLIAAPLFQPLDLTITEIRLDPARFAPWAVAIIAVSCVTGWVAWQLGLASVGDTIISA